ncbi:hypothetical protein BHE74_00033000 [Ensete ventricosum]|nr:hypothetical protein BHE74_00033000 [Ensete ventricosum]
MGRAKRPRRKPGSKMAYRHWKTPPVEHFVEHLDRAWAPDSGFFSASESSASCPQSRPEPFSPPYSSPAPHFSTPSSCPGARRLKW